MAGPGLLRALGVSEHEMILSNEVRAPNNQSLSLLGGMFLNISGMEKDGNTRVSKQLCYVSRYCSALFLSKAACRDLGNMDKKFPTIGNTEHSTVANLGEQEKDNKEFSGYGTKTEMKLSKAKSTIKCEHDKEMTCVCPRRSIAPDAPTALPFPATKDNHGKLQQWIIDRYSASAFNQCECQPLPLMTNSLPLKLYIDPQTKPVAIHCANPLPVQGEGRPGQGLLSGCP